MSSELSRLVVHGGEAAGWAGAGFAALLLVPINSAFNPIILLLFPFASSPQTIHPHATLERVPSPSFARWETEARGVFLVPARSHHWWHWVSGLRSDSDPTTCRVVLVCSWQPISRGGLG